MKKILLILFISYAFISSANANSIKGAFGYELGDVYKKSDRAYTYKFTPKNTFPGLDDYSVTTGTDNRILNITSKTLKYSYTLYNCRQGNYSPFKRLLNLLQTKYGQFEKVLDERREYSGRLIDEVEYKYENEDRYIYLSCNTYSENGTTDYRLWLEYQDNTLFKKSIEDLSFKLQDVDSILMLDL